MKLLFAISFSLLILVQPLSKMLIVMQYQVNKNYIARVLCENKAEPKKGCNGKCHLAKELKKAGHHEENLPTSLKEKVEILYFCETVPFYSFSFLPDIAVNQFPFIRPESSPPVFGIFQPPRLLT